jgi:hypothetical protein
MKTPHKHAELIKAWADGAEIQYFSKYEDKWFDSKDPHWDAHSEYRIKPEPKPDVIKYVTVGLTKGRLEFATSNGEYPEDHLKITFCGETGNFKSAEVLK